LGYEEYKQGEIIKNLKNNALFISLKKATKSGKSALPLTKPTEEENSPIPKQNFKPMEKE